MSGFNTVGQFTPNYKTWDHVGNVIPVVEHSEGQRPHGEFRPAPWLPVRFFEKFYENYVTIMPGKIVAFDNNGWVVPAQYGLTGATIVYTATDVSAGVIDVRTGAALTAAATINVSDVSTYMGGTSALAVSKPVGVCPLPVLQWAGDGTSADDGFNPAAYIKLNYNMQHRVAILCDYVLELPIVPAAQAAVNLAYASYASNVATFAAVANLPVAVNTVRTPIAFTNGTKTDPSTRFANQVANLTDIKELGDWYINYDTGVVSCYFAADPGAGNLYKIAYYHYASAPTGSSVSIFACVLGDVKPGDFLKCNADSNWVKATTKTYGVGAGDNFDTFADIMGQVLDVETQPKDMLDKVRTAFASLGTSAAGAYPGYAGQMDQMPGTATGGVTDKVHYAGAANKVCRVNLVSR